MQDILEVIVSPDKQFEFHLTGINITGKHFENLVVKAYNLLQSNYKLPPVKIHLHKIIPIGAGLGGGSSDAAYTIKVLNDLFNLGLSIVSMQDYARQLGSDCAFFIENKPVIATNKGDHFETIDLNLKNYFFTIIQPNIHISTPEAYSWIKPTIKKQSLRELINQPVENWKTYLKNDFENEVFKRYPDIKVIKETLYKSGAVYASMTGSGAAVFGIFQKAVPIENEFQNYNCWTGMAQ